MASEATQVQPNATIPGVPEAAMYDDPTGRRSDLMAVFEEHEKKNAPESVVAKPAPVKPEVAAEPPEVAETVEAPEQETEHSAEAAAETAEAKPATESLEPPKNWKQSDKEVFGALPDEAKRIVLKREKERDADYTKKTMELAEFRKSYQPIEEMIAPYRPMMQASGYTPATLFQAWMNTERMFVEGKGEDAIRQIAKAYNIDLAKVAGIPAALPGASPQQTEEEKQRAEAARLLEPYLSPFKTEIDGLKGQLSQFQTAAQQRSQWEQMEKLRGVEAQLKAVAEERDKDGNLVRPYFEELTRDMGIMALGYKNAGVPIPSAQELYNTAVYANPSTRERLLSAQQQAAEQKRLAEARAKSASAARAGKSVTGAPAQRQPTNGAALDSIRASLEDAYETHMSR